MDEGPAGASLDSKQRDQFGVRGRELELGELRSGRPLQFLALLRLRLARDLAGEEMELDPAVDVGVGDREHFVADPGLDVQLFAQLARQAGGQRLAAVALAARKFPAS